MWIVNVQTLIIDRQFKKVQFGGVKNMIPYIIGGGVMVVIFGLIEFFGKKRMKEGKVDKHWKDY
ncbi:MAG: hypothetical protein ABIH78_00795 [Candidatus Peregrinibacteria bacterium]